MTHPDLSKEEKKVDHRYLLSVDVPEDLDKVREILKNNPKLSDMVEAALAIGKVPMINFVPLENIQTAEDRREMTHSAGQGKEPFGLSENEIQTLLDKSLKPEEIAGPVEVQHDRVRELIRWFARGGNPKWFQSHAYELVYYIATTASNRFIDLDAIRQKAFMQGVNTTPDERALLARFSPVTPTPPPKTSDHGTTNS